MKLHLRLNMTVMLAGACFAIKAQNSVFLNSET